MRIKVLKLIDCGCSTAVYEEVFTTVLRETEVDYITDAGVFAKSISVVLPSVPPSVPPNDH
jgi:hypothetical protein